MQRYSLLLLITLLLLPSLVFSQGEVSKKGATAANFLKLDVGARAVALGGAYTALSNDGAAMHYNPAGLADVEKIGLTYHNVDLYVDIRQQFFGLVIPFGEANTIGFYTNYVDMGTIERTTTADPDGWGQNIYAHSAAYGITFARRLTDRVLFGVGVKYAIEKIWNESAVGASVDFGAIYEPGVGGLRMGLSIKHLGPEMRMDKGPALTFYKQPNTSYPGQREIAARLETDKYPMPVTFSVGVAFDFVGPTSVVMANDANRFSVITEVNDAFDAPIRSIFGLEYEWNNLLSLRGGIKQNYDVHRYSFGGGLKIPVRNSELVFDYAYADYGDLDGIYVTSIELRF